MFKKFASFALFLAVTGIFAATSVDAQRLVLRSVTRTESTTTKSTEPTFDAVEPEANPAVDLDQCQNGAIDDLPAVINCGPGWANGNANGNNSHYAEGRNIHYRLKFSNLTVGVRYTVTLAFDKTHGNTGLNNAIDFLNNYDAGIVTGYTVDPCFGVAGCGGAPVAIPIEDDPTITFDPAGRFMSAWGISALPADAPTMNGIGGANDGWQLTTIAGQVEQQFTVTFTAASTNPVLGWSGHIALRSDWMPLGEDSASSITGSPYHMRVVSNTGWGGQQDRSLSTDAIIAPSAAGAEVSGRVTDRYGRAIWGAQLTLMNATTGEPVVVYTNTFGYYSFSDVPVGEFYFLSVAHRRYSFVNSTASFSLEDNLAGIDFQATR